MPTTGTIKPLFTAAGSNALANDIPTPIDIGIHIDQSMIAKTGASSVIVFSGN